MFFSTFVLKNLIRRKVRTTLTMLGISIAVVVVICLVGVSDDFRESLVHSYEKQGVDLIVVRAKRAQRVSSSIDQSVAEQIKALPGVADVEGGLMDIVSSDESHLDLTPVIGRQPDSFLVRDLRMKSGRRLTKTDLRCAMLGALIAEHTEKQVGDQIDVEGEPFTVVGVYEAFNSFDNGAILVLRSELQRLLDRPNEVTGFSVRLDPQRLTEETVRTVESQIEELRDKNGKSWNLSAMQTRDFMNSVFEMQAARSMAWVTSFVALLIGAVGMLNTMLMSVFERTREMGILRAIGWRKSRIMTVILCESLLMSAGGALIGTIGAMIFISLLHQLPAAQIVVPTTVNPFAVVQGVVVALAMGLLGGLYPAWRAMHIPLTEAIRHE